LFHLDSAREEDVVLQMNVMVQVALTPLARKRLSPVRIPPPLHDHAPAV